MTTPNAVPPNPANKSAIDERARRRIPMAVPRRKLEVPEIPGYSLYWFLERNVPAATQGGYDPVLSNEVTINQQGVGTDSLTSGNADLGSGVKVVAGAGAEGKGEYLVLMKIREEWRREDQKTIEARNASVMEAIFRGEKILGSENMSQEDKDARYVRAPLFQRPTRKG